MNTRIESKAILATVSALGVLAGSVAMASSGGEVLNVPSDYATIQQAVDAASDGNMIKVAAGTYEETVDLRGKAITLEAAVPLASIIKPENGARAISAVSGETRDTVIRGFTFVPELDNGGGVVTNASPTIDSCAFVNCVNGTGGGLLSTGGSPLLTGCTFQECTATDTGYTYGGGGGARFVGGQGEVIGCLFLGCVSERGNGGGIMQEGGGHLTVSESTFTSCYAMDLWGAALYNAYANITVRDSIFESMSGMVLHGWTSFTIENCIFRDIASGGDCIEVKSGVTTVLNTVFENCNAESGILGQFYSGSYALGNNTFCSCSGNYVEGSWTDLGGNAFDVDDCQPDCPGDLNLDGVIDGGDVTIVLGWWGTSGEGAPTADVNDDGFVDGADLTAILAAWGPCE